VSWDLISRRLERALERDGTHTVEDVIHRVNTGEAQWWGREDGVAITELYCFPRKTYLNIWLTAGDMDACLALEPEIEVWARAKGCTELRANGRPGWTALCDRRGWQVHNHQWTRTLL
jgi:hypothetical protein